MRCAAVGLSGMEFAANATWNNLFEPVGGETNPPHHNGPTVWESARDWRDLLRVFVRLMSRPSFAIDVLT